MQKKVEKSMCEVVNEYAKHSGSLRKLFHLAVGIYKKGIVKNKA